MTRRGTVVTAIVCGAVVVGAIAFGLWWPGIPNAQDAEIARAIWRCIREGHGGFLDPDDDDQDGKAIVWSPGVRGNPGIIVYGITTPKEMDDIEKLAREALHATPGAKSVTLAFYDWRLRPEGVHERQSRKLLREVSFER